MIHKKLSKHDWKKILKTCQIAAGLEIIQRMMRQAYYSQKYGKEGKKFQKYRWQQLSVKHYLHQKYHYEAIIIPFM